MQIYGNFEGVFDLFFKVHEVWVGKRMTLVIWQVLLFVLPQQKLQTG